MKIPSLPGKRRIATALAVLAVAFGTGHVMQSVLVERTPMANVDDMPDAAFQLRDADRSRSLPTPPAATLVPILPRPPVLPDRVDKPVQSVPELWEDARMSPFGFSCEPELNLTARPAAMVEVSVFVPCDAGEIVTFRHGALSFALKSDVFGRAMAVLPALSPRVNVDIATPRRSASATIGLPEAADFSRVIIAWDGPQIFRMNAYELGSGRGQSGHIRASSPKTAARAVRGTGGFLVTVGDGSGGSAEVYTFPTGFSPLRGVVELVVEADVTRETCGTTAEAQALQSSPLGGLTGTDVRVTLPDCDRLGEVMELKNLLQDMRLAGR
jgi:hypothetical protein